MAFFQMSAIVKFDFQKRKQLRFSEVNYLNYKKDPILHVATTFSLKHGEKNKPWTHSTPLKINNFAEKGDGYFKEFLWTR